MLFGAVTYTSCKRDKCKEITCAFGAACVEGTCYCATGYEGTQCEKLIRAKFTGTWSATEAGTQTLTEEYPLDVEEGTEINKVKIRNFNNRFGPGMEINAIVSGDTMYIPRQSLDAKVVEGRGYLVPSKYYQEHSEMVVHYYVYDSATGKTNDFGWDFGKPAEWLK